MNKIVIFGIFLLLLDLPVLNFIIGPRYKEFGVATNPNIFYAICAYTVMALSWFIIDENLKQYYNFDSLPNIIYYKCTEATKSFENIHVLLNQFTENKFKSNTEVVIIGGGTLQDVAGFCCSVYSRGIKYRLVPTTLLAQCDSCVGGKTSINYNSTKSWPNFQF